MIEALLGLLSGGGSILIAALTAIVALIGLFFRVRHTAKAEVRNELEVKSLRTSVRSTRAREDIDGNLSELSDDELDKLRQQYTTG
jgi:hypothetical protein